MTLSHEYQLVFDRLVADAAEAVTTDVPLVPFWPLRGATYAGELLVIGRSVNGWVQDWTAGELRDPIKREAAVAWMRRDAEAFDGDRMAWVTDLWGAREGYSTRRSAFWRVLSQLTPAGLGTWPGRLVWTNLYKISPAAGWNPGADLQKAQRAAAIELLRRELNELAPRRVLALTGNWVEPFKTGLQLELEERFGLVEGIGERDGAAWVVAKHPMGKPGAQFVAEVAGGFSDAGRPLT